MPGSLLLPLVLLGHLCSQHSAHTGMHACFPACFQQGAVSDGLSVPGPYMHGVWAAVYLQRMLLSESVKEWMSG